MATNGADRTWPRLVYVVAAVAATGGLLFGFDTGVISGALLFLREEFSLGTHAQEQVVSAVLVGAMLGALIGGRLADMLGRRLVIFFTALVFLLGTVLVSSAQSVDMLLAGRVVLGLGIGVASLAVPLYISEMSPPPLRGALVSLNQLMITIGIVLSYLVDEAFSGLTNGWRWMFLFGALPAVLLGIGMLFLPRSPRWMATKGRGEEARKVLERLGVADPVEVQEALRSSEGKGRLGDLLRPDIRRVAFLGVAIMFIQQATGINTVIYYAPSIFEMAGFKSASAAIWATVVVGVVNVLMTVVAIRLLDRVGRRPLLSVGLAGMSLGLFALGLAFSLQNSLGEGLRWVAVGSLLVYVACFALSLGPIAWLLIAEIYPLRIRGAAMSVATLSNWLFNFLIALSFLSIVETLGKPGAFWLYAGVGALGWVFCRMYVPETKGVKLEQIEANVEAGRPLRDLGV